MGDSGNKFSCVIIGSGSLPIRCAEIVLRDGHKISAIVSTDTEVKKWAKEKKISCFVPGTNLADQIKQPFDYLLSIVNENILSEDILQLPRKLAINYHDAPLPRYAGTHATSWALMNGETVHGVSWHVITDVVDAGDILKQLSVEITKDDTALTLNTKCYEAAINSFAELVEGLSTGNVVAKKQNLKERTFFPRFKRPANGGVISWNNRADEISALVRALNFGNHPNPLGVPKFVVENEFLIASELEILDSVSKSEPGTINEIGENFFRISSADKEIILRKILSLDGRPVSIAELVENFHLREGYQLADFNAETTQRIEKNYKANCKHETYWVKKLSALEPAVPPFASSASRSDSARYENVPMPIPVEVLTFLEQSPKEPNTSDFVLAAFGALLARLGGVDSLDVGYSDSEIKREIGGLEKLFADQLPLRFNIDRRQNSAELLRSTEKKIESVKNHQTYSHDLLTRFPQLRSASESGNNFTLPVTVAKVVWVDDYQPTDENELVLVISENEAACRWIYDRNRIDVQNVDKLISHFTTFLKGIAANPECQIAYLPLLTEEERHQLLVAWNDNHAEFPNDQCIHNLFEAHALRTPDAVAMIFDERRITYHELNQHANQLANYLRNLGVGSEVQVCVFVEPSLDIGVALLGIFKAGGVYVPLDPDYPLDRLAAILEDNQPRVILTQSHLLSKLPPITAEIFCFDRDEQSLEHLPTRNPEHGIDLNQTAYILYTSGTTGRPKGVMASYLNLVHYISVAQEHYGFDRSMVMPAFARFTFSITFFELLNPLVAGGTLVILERDHILDFGRMSRTLEHLTVIHASPSLLKRLLGYIEDNGLDLERFHGLKHVSTGGDLVPPDVLEAMKRVFQKAEIYVIYGCSEVSCMACTNFVSRKRRVNKTLVGRPFANMSIRIYDSNRNSVPANVAGEVYISGTGLTKGYLHQQELTNKKFVLIDGQRFYRTGDRGRFDAKGNLEILGRTDFQIKLNGVRIEPSEIETLLRQVPGVREAVVVKRELSSREPGLVAYLVLNPTAPAEISDIRHFLLTKLPRYMIPSGFVILDALPLNFNQKIDRRALPSPDHSSLQLAEEHVKPRTALEKQIAEIWSEVLGIDNIGIRNEFFELGGQSLLATQVVSRLSNLLQVELSVRSLFEYPTIAGLAEWITELRNRPETNNSISQILPISRKGNLPLSFSQRRLWYLNQLEGKSATYNIPIAVQLNGTLNTNALERAIQTIVQRHEILRTIFQTVNGEPVQVIVPDVAPTLCRIDLRAIPAADQASEVQRLITKEAQNPFDLNQPPLFRITLLETSSESCVLLMNFYHIIYDGWSIECFAQEISTLYAAFCAEKPNPLPELPIQYADFAYWQMQNLTGEVLQNSLGYWRQQLDGVPTRLDLPADRPRPAAQTFRGSSRFFLLESEIAQKLRVFSQKSGATSFMTLLTAFATLLSRFSRHEDIVIGCPIANRNRSELESLIGFFVNTLPLRIDLQGNPSFLELLAQVRRVSLDAYEHQDVPFEKIVEDLNPERSLSYSPLFQVMFVLQNAPMGKLELPGIAVKPIDVERGVSMFDLTLWITETESGLRGEWEYNTDLFDASTIERMESHFKTLLNSVLENPEQPISQISSLTETERHQLLVTWNDIKTEYSEDESISQLIEAQVYRTPEATALIFGNDHLTYQELNQRANRLANYLQTLDVGPEVLVGICLERSVEMIVGILAVLKAGGAYVPLDPAYPQERIEYMLADSQAPVLITLENLIDGLSHYQGKVVRLDSDAERIVQEPEENPIPLAKPNNLAYVIYTSGSTGKPKGVAIEHHSTVALIHWANSVFNAEQLKGVLASTSICFDLSVYEMFVPLSCGGSIILVENVLHLPTIPAANEVTLINTVPSAITELLRIKGVPPSVRTVNLAGEPLKISLVRQIYELGSVKEVFDLYGPTEDTTYSTFTLRNRDKATIGRPISNTQAYILDRYMQPVPVGIPGELYLGGNGLARGYLNRPELTDERFVKNPFSNDPTARLYKTGDLVSYLQTGEIEYLDRIDNQVKIRGFRIELGEIETVLLSHSSVSETVVVSREDQPGDKRLAAYFVPAQDSTVSVGDIRDFLKQKLPDYMIPSVFVELAELPLTPNGKIDRKALPAPASTASESKTDFVAHRDDLELRLVRIWESILGIRPIGVEDNFFELGGHSLKAVRMFAEVEEAFGKNIPLATLFEAGTVEKLAAILRQDGWAAPESSIVPIQPNGTKPPFFCIHAKGGNVLFYRDLAKYLGDDQPFYGIQARRLAGRQIGHATVEEMAEFYIKEIQTLQPEGPYYLGGSSFGGLAAFEIVQQLRQKGERVALLALLDTGTPDYPRKLPNNTGLRSKMYEWVRRIQHHRDSLRAFNSRERADYVLDKLRKVKLRYRRKIINSYKKAVRGYYLKTKGAGSIPKNYIQIQDLIWKAGQQYSPKVYCGNMTLFRASIQPLGIYQDPTLGWENFVDGELEIHEVPGHHGSIVAEPYVRVLAEKLSECIESIHLKEERFFEKPKSLEARKGEFAKAAGFQSIS